MADLIYSTISSLDGYIADETGSFDWAAPDEEVHTFVNELERPIGTYLYGRRMYEVMVAWENPEAPAGSSPATQDYARIWQAADKIIYSRTLAAVSSAKTRIERDLDLDAIRRLKQSAGADISVGGPHLAAQLIAAGLVDRYQFFLHPVLVGGGNPSIPDHFRIDLELVDERRFASGVVYLHYRTRG